MPATILIDIGMNLEPISKVGIWISMRDFRTRAASFDKEYWAVFRGEGCGSEPTVGNEKKRDFSVFVRDPVDAVGTAIRSHNGYIFIANFKSRKVIMAK